MRRPVLIRFGLSLLSAVLLFLSVPTFGLWPLMWVGLVPQMLVALDARRRARFLYGWVTGLVANAAAFYWIDGLLERFGHMPPSRRCRSTSCSSPTRGSPSGCSRGSSGGPRDATRSADAARAADDDRARAGGAAPLPLVPGDLPGVGAAGHPDRRPHRARSASPCCWSRSTARSTSCGRASRAARSRAVARARDGARR